MIDYDKIAAEYIQHRQIHPRVLQNLVSTGGITGDFRALEVGCGTGNYITAIESATGCLCWGIDPSERMLLRASEQSQNINFQAGKAEQIAFESDFFDLVFSVDVIHHVANHLAYFRKAFRVLKMGGKLCTVTDSEWIIRNRQPLSTYFPETVEAELARYPRIAALRALTQQVGFGNTIEQTVEFATRLTDIQIYRDKAFSALHVISEDAFQRGIKRMEHDLRSGPIPYVSRYVLLWATK